MNFFRPIVKRADATRCNWFEFLFTVFTRSSRKQVEYVDQFDNEMNYTQKIEKVKRLRTAYTKCKVTSESRPLVQEIDPGTIIASNWGIITAAYSGLEQSIKYLIAEEKSCTIEELIKHQEYKTHNLASLFSYLKEKNQSLIRNYYSQFQSLHSYIEIEKLDDFLWEVSGPQGTGYERWRYSLIEDEERLPRNSTEAMVAIWGICVEISLSQLLEKEKMRMLEEELVEELYDGGFLKSVTKIEDAVPEGKSFPNLQQEANDRLFRDDHKLNVFAKIFQHFGCCKSHGLSNLSDELSKAVDLWLEEYINIEETKGKSSLCLFIRRASGSTSYGESIRWDTGSGRFINVDWSLDLVSNEVLPNRAITRMDTSGFCYLQNLKSYSNECGYKVRENRSDKIPLDSNTAVYFRTLEVCEPNTKDSVITVWQKSRRSNEFTFVVEQPKNKILPPVQHWISLLGG